MIYMHLVQDHTKSKKFGRVVVLKLLSVVERTHPFSNENPAWTSFFCLFYGPSQIVIRHALAESPHPADDATYL